MARVRRRDTVPELRLRKALWDRGLRYRVDCNLPGRPDIMIVKARLVVFVDGCFWHCCPRHSTWPKQNAAFWRRKLSANVRRDRINTKLLRDLGWRVERVWEHSVETELEAVVDRIVRLTREV